MGVETGLDGDVAHQQLAARGGAPHRRGRTADPRQVEQGVVDLTQFDAPSADLHLVVGAAHEQQPGLVVHHQIARPVGPLPPQRRQRSVLLGVLDGVEVAGQADPTDDQLAGAAGRHRVAGRVDDRKVPAVQWQADANRRFAGQLGAAGDHGGLGGAVGVPDLALRGDQPGAQFGRAGLAAQNQQPHPGQGFHRPQRHQGRHGAHHGDAVGLQPGPQVHARAHQRAWRRHQAGPVAPRQPHLFARGVEGHRQPGHHPVAHPQRGVSEKDPGLGVDERGGVAVGDRHPLGLAGRARGEDHPGVVVGGRVDPFCGWPDRAPAGDLEIVADHRAHVGLGEHGAGALVGIVGVDRHVGCAGQQNAHDRHVQLGGARSDAHADLVARADAQLGQVVGHVVGGVRELVVGQHGRAVVERLVVAAFGDGFAKDVHQGARWWGERAAQQGHETAPHAVVRPLDSGGACIIAPPGEQQVNGSRRREGPG